MFDTTVMIDNTTFAAAGRTFYFADPDTEGGRHARAYYAAFPDARTLDQQSAGEFLTALILFDKLRWDSASSGAERPPPSSHPGDADYPDDHEYWLYAWFPLFSKAKNLGIIGSFEERYISANRLGRAKALALKWVQEQIVTEAFTLPSGFRVPLAYYSEEYSDREEFEKLNEGNGYPLTEHQLAIAMFLHRGLYYQSYCYGPNELMEAEDSEDDLNPKLFERWSYLPHAHRASLLGSPSWNLLAMLCNDGAINTELVEVRRVIPNREYPFIYKMEITPPELMQELDLRFFRALDKTVKIGRIPGGIALGASFLQRHRHDTSRALESALEFRESKSGREVRGFFRELVALGKTSNKQAIEDRLGDFDALLQDAARSYFGTSWTADPKGRFLLGLLGGWKDVLAQALEMIPRHIREAVTRVLYSSTHEHGFQILFKRYL